MKLRNARKIRSIGSLALFIPFIQSSYICPYPIPWIVCSECEIFYCLFNPRTLPLRDNLAYGIFASGFGFGRVFCSWLCPYGVLQENLMRIGKIKTSFPFLDKRVRVIRLVIFIVTLLIVFLLVFPILISRQIIPDFLRNLFAPTYMLTFPIIIILSQNFDIVWIIRIFGLFAFLILAIYVGRAWCSVCPLGYLLGFFNRISIVKLESKKEICEKHPNICEVCKNVCQTRINPTSDTDKVECVRCLDCYYACPAKTIQKMKVLTYEGKVKKA